jgi:alpha,alpha-trehalose phosphorylase
MAAVAGFGGFRDFGGKLSFAPRLPEAISRLAYRLFFRGRRILIDVGPRHAVYSLLDGKPLDVSHHGELVTLAERSPVTRPIPPLDVGRAPPPPPGRAPTPAGPDGHPTAEAEHPTHPLIK